LGIGAVATLSHLALFTAAAGVSHAKKSGVRNREAHGLTPSQSIGYHFAMKTQPSGRQLRASWMP